MSERGPQPDCPPLPLEVEQQIDRVSDEFERAWTSGQTPRIEDYLDRVPTVGRLRLLEELLAVEFDLRRSEVSTLEIDVYRQRFPGGDEVIRAALALHERRSRAAVRDDAERQAVCRANAKTEVPLPERIGRFRIERLVGTGAFGSVYLAHDTQLDRSVALKVPRADRFPTEQDVKRLVQEARAAAQLNHPGIVTIHDVGQEDDQVFIVLQYIPGEELGRGLKREALSLERIVELVARVAEAMAYAHRKGFVHRDLKPGNILLDEQGQPHVADFGLAVHESMQRQLRGDIAGTLDYMSPEQLRGETHHLDGRSDIWSLGVIFYELLTGQRPFGGTTTAQIRDEILERPAKPPRQINDGIPAELERICQKCLAKEVTSRYATAADLARELRRWQKPRRQFLTAAIATAAALLVVAVAAAVWQVGRRTPPAAPPVVGELQGSIDLQVWNPTDTTRRRLSLREPRTLPLRLHDQVRVEVHVNRPAYVYILWINNQGLVMPLYPWKEGDWAKRPSSKDEPLVREVVLPDVRDEGWEVKPPFGTETLLLMARDKPLPREVELKDLLADLPIPPLPEPDTALWFTEGRLLTKAEDQLRGIDPGQTTRIIDPLLRAQEMIHKQLGPHFTLQCVVSFVSQGE